MTKAPMPCRKAETNPCVPLFRGPVHILAATIRHPWFDHHFRNSSHLLRRRVALALSHSPGLYWLLKQTNANESESMHAFLHCLTFISTPCQAPRVVESHPLKDEGQSGPAMLATLWAEHGMRAQYILRNTGRPVCVRNFMRRQHSHHRHNLAHLRERWPGFAGLWKEGSQGCLCMHLRRTRRQMVRRRTRGTLPDRTTQLPSQRARPPPASGETSKNLRCRLNLVPTSGSHIEPAWLLACSESL